MRRSIPIAEAKAHFSDCVRLAEEGQTLLLTRHGRGVAVLASAEVLPALEAHRSATDHGTLAELAGTFSALADEAPPDRSPRFEAEID